MIFLFTDYGLEAPYIGQVQTVLYRQAPHEKIINLLSDSPRNNPKAGAYLLAALTSDIPECAILFCVIDPGVGGNQDKPLILKIDGRWFVGPDNGLFDIVARRAKWVKAWEITWRPENLSNSFHGRDLYAPVCARLANDDTPGKQFVWQNRHQWPDDLYEVIYIDHFGNCMTGIRSSQVDKAMKIRIVHGTVDHAETFSKVPEGQPFWYGNSNQLVEIAVNRGSAAQQLKLRTGDMVKVVS